MITLLLILILLGVLFMAISLGAALLVDPIIAILIFIGLYKLVKWIFGKKK